jgi:DHA2 family multidrug resistance protein
VAAPARRGPSPDLPRSAAGPNSPWLLAVVVSIATFMEVLDTTIANVALRHIAGGLAASQDESTWIITSYLVSNAIVLPISGWLANVIGRKRFYMICVALFTASSLMCALSTSLAFMLFWRVVQGVGGGGLAPTEQSIFADSFPPAMRAQAFALYGLTVVVAPAIGPLLGGVLTDTFSWHWVFLINVPIGILSLTLTWFFVYEPEALVQQRKRLLSRGLKLDGLGFALVVLGFGALQIVLDRFQQDDGFSSPFIRTLAIVSAVSLVALVIWEAYHPRPIMDVKLWKHRSFLISSGVMFLVGFMLISTTQLLPQFSQEQLGYDATDAGSTLALGGIATLVLMPVAGLVTGRIVQPRYLTAGALASSGLAMFYLAGLDPTPSFWTLSIARALQAMSLPFLFIPISAASYVGIPPEKNNEASAIINLMRNLGGSVGVSFVTTMLQWRIQFHHARLAEHVTPYDRLDGRSVAQMGALVQAQASVMSYLDVFWLLGMIAILAWPAALFLRNIPKGQPAGH